jgi:hypothetical protein
MFFIMHGKELFVIHNLRRRTIHKLASYLSSGTLDLEKILSRNLRLDGQSLQIITPRRRTIIFRGFHSNHVPARSLRAAFQPEAARRGQNIM